jgi:hypothetical protein
MEIRLRTSLRLRRFRFLAVGVLVLLAVFMGLKLAASGTRRGSDQAHLGAYGGYVWRGRVVSLGGSWIVPQILNVSRPGLAVTWIAASGLGARRPFVQVGTEELRGYSRSHRVENRYWAFWSNTARHFHPVFLFRVRPRDALSASLILTHERWALTVVDETSRANAHFFTNEEAGPFNEAEWAQEDATDSTGSLFSYPSLSVVGFHHLAVNSTVPSYASLFSVWLSVNGGHSAPSPLKNDAFVLRRATITPSGGRYLRISEKSTAAARVFGAEIARLLLSPSYTQVSSASQRFIAALESEVRALQRARLPASVRGMTPLLIAKLHVLREQARPPAVMSTAALVLWRSALSRDTEALLDIEHPIRRILAVPELP